MAFKSKKVLNWRLRLKVSAGKLQLIHEKILYSFAKIKEIRLEAEEIVFESEETKEIQRDVKWKVWSKRDCVWILKNLGNIIVIIVIIITITITLIIIIITIVIIIIINKKEGLWLNWTKPWNQSCWRLPHPSMVCLLGDWIDDHHVYHHLDHFDDNNTLNRQ